MILQWQEKSREIDDHAKARITVIQCLAIQTMPTLNRRVPLFGDWIAGEYVGEQTSGSVAGSEEDGQPNGESKGPAGEDAQIEDQDGNLAQCRARRVKCLGKHVILRCSAAALILTGGANEGVSFTLKKPGTKSRKRTSQICFAKPY